ncbi:hypothetical protein LSUB1_G004327 [Lachnellula subtilissima]|uniref:Uncharacterized protein n=1 Tax=Lachnellula subtilissima TaxID=602034 RepID=A0A8H8RR67_9HELO|nr:hypothetical protein LSUB1_G004327 [Lachnellula subtilissima]
MDEQMDYDPEAQGPGEEIRIGSMEDVSEHGEFFRLAPQPSTHDTSHTEEHATIKQLGEDIESAVKAGWPRVPGTRYKRVHALLLSWEEDDLGVIKEIERLRCVLKNTYQYSVESYEIPSRKPDAALKRRVLEFLDDDAEDILMIVYYGGHARRGNQTSAGPLWVANRKSTSSAILSSGVQSLFEQANADVLLLYDCCHSAAMTTGCHQSSTSVTEVIAACGFETSAPEVDEHSFTNALIHTLVISSKGPNFSVAGLTSRILSRLRCWTASLLYNDDGSLRQYANGDYIFERQPRRTPIYNILCESKNRRSIILSPPTNTESISRVSTQEHSNASCSSALPPVDVGMAIGSSKEQELCDKESAKWPQVILTIRLDSAQLEVDTWKEYILSFPAEAKDIKIEGVYGSFSTMLIVRMPVTDQSSSAVNHSAHKHDLSNVHGPRQFHWEYFWSCF